MVWTLVGVVGVQCHGVTLAFKILSTTLDVRSIQNPRDVIYKNFHVVEERGQNLHFYCVNTSYPMDNSLSGRRRPARQTSEKDVLCLHRQVGP